MAQDDPQLQQLDKARHYTKGGSIDNEPWEVKREIYALGFMAIPEDAYSFADGLLLIDTIPPGTDLPGPEKVAIGIRRWADQVSRLFDTRPPEKRITYVTALLPGTKMRASGLKVGDEVELRRDCISVFVNVTDINDGALFGIIRGFENDNGEGLDAFTEASPIGFAESHVFHCSYTKP